MTELIRALSDDQLAIIGCVAALVVGGLLVQLTYSIGPASRTANHDPARVLSARPQPLRHADDRAA